MGAGAAELPVSGEYDDRHSRAGPVAPALPEPLGAPIVDAHTHLDACAGRTERDVRAAMDRAEAVGVVAAVTVADDLESARWVPKAAGWDARVVAAVALHPTRAGGLDDAVRDELARLAAGDRVVAIGESGLDYYWPQRDPGCADPAIQREAFGWHIELAKRLGKPLMIHDRDAHDDVLAVLKAEGPPETVIMHCFSGDAALAERCADAGYLMSFAGPVTFRNARELREAAAVAPAELLLVETDAPFLTPHPHRGKPNEPYCLPWTLRGLADIRGVHPDQLADTVRANAERVFRLDKLR
ncbi:MAG: TatD family hydrolase [Pseudonocardia sp.]|nr:TatD family hydrolase [Pseudonocardia sp.]